MVENFLISTKIIDKLFKTHKGRKSALSFPPKYWRKLIIFSADIKRKYLNGSNFNGNFADN